MRTSVTITFASDAKLSSAGVLPPGNDFYGVEMPAGFDAGNLTFRVSTDGVTYRNLADDAGNDVTLTAPAVDEVILFRDTIYNALRHYTHVKLRASVDQTANRIFFLLSREK